MGVFEPGVMQQGVIIKFDRGELCLRLLKAMRIEISVVGFADRL